MLIHHTRCQPQRSTARRFARAVCLVTCLACALPTAVSAYRLPVSQAGTPTAGQTSEVLWLVPGQTIERELAGGQAHSYQLTLTAGQFLQVIAEQHEIDVIIVLLKFDGAKVVERDGRWYGPETLSLVVESSGPYRLEVAARAKNASRGHYILKLHELRSPGQQDAQLIAGEQASTQAKGSLLKGTPVGRLEAIRHYEAALTHWQSLHDDFAVAQTLHTIGHAHLLLGKGKEALPYLEQAQTLRHKLGDYFGEAETLSNLASFFSATGDKQKALSYYEQALELYRRSQSKRGEADMLASLGVIYSVLGDSEKSLQYLALSVPLREAIKDYAGAALTALNLGGTYNLRGENQRALESLKQALPLFRETGDRRGEAATLNNLGKVAAELDDLQTALSYFHQALAGFKDLDDRRSAGAVLSSIGASYRLLGEPQRALDYHKQSLELLRAAGDRHLEAYTLNNLALIHNELDEPDQAVFYLRQALPLAHAAASKQLEGGILNNWGLSFSKKGEQQQALDFFTQALASFRASGDRRNEAHTLANLAEIAATRGELQQARDYCARALELCRAVKDTSGEATIYHGLARLERRRGNDNEARVQAKAALDIVETLRGKLSVPDWRSSYVATTWQIAELYLDALMRLHQRHPTDGWAAAALQASEQLRARSLVELLGRARLSVAQGIAPELRARERELQQLISAKANRQVLLLSSKHTAEQAAAAEREIESLRAAYQQVEAQIRATSPHYAEILKPLPLSLKEIQQQVLDGDTLLLEYSLGEERSYLWTVSANSFKSYELPKRGQVEDAAHRLLAGLSVPRGRRTGESVAQQQQRAAELDAKTHTAAAELSRMLLPKAAELGKRRLVVVADGILQYIPFAALTKQGAAGRGVRGKRSNGTLPLLVDHEIISLPSASTLAVLRRELAGRRPAPKILAALADPVFSAAEVEERLQESTKLASAPSTPSLVVPATQTRTIQEMLKTSTDNSEPRLRLPRLRLSGEEALTIAKFVSPEMSKISLGFAANYATATGPEMAEYRHLLFATHGWLDDRQPESTGILLSLVDEQKREQNGLLRLGEIYNLKLQADLVTLSACQTALGKEVRGEGLVGLTRGFMYAGAARVVASLWNVEEEGTKELMIRFYRGMLKQGLRPAAALRQAQLSMLRQPEWRSPYYWSAFILQGEWR